MTDIPEDIFQTACGVVMNAKSLKSMLKHKDVVDAIAIAILAERERHGWQPIETAPKDGTDFLVCDNRVGGGFMNVVSYTDEDYPNVFETQEFLAYHKDAFTHWHPLPSPPKP